MIKFWTPKGKFGFLSNFFAAPITVDSVAYATTEHYFQAMKFYGTQYHDHIKDLETPAQAAREGKNRAFPLRRDWEQVKESVMYQALRAKFTQHLELKKRLLETGDHELIEDSPYDYYWGVGQEGTGKNRLGVLLMKLRDELKVGV